MRTLTLGIALSALVGSLALAQSGNNGTSNTTGNASGNGTTSTKSSNGQAGNQNGNQTKGSNTAKSSSTAAPTPAGQSPTTVATNSTSNVAKVSGRTIAQTLSDNENLDTLESLVTQAGLAGTFSGNGSYTVFAPTDAAFELLGEATVTELTNPQNKSKLTAILTYHVVPGAMTSNEFGKTWNANTVNGQRIGLAGSNGNFTVEKVAITQTDIKCSNGVIHVIDAVLVPTQSNLVEIAGGNEDYSTFLKACKAAGLDATLAKNGNFTVFAPTNEAFAKLPAGMLEMLMQPENRLQLREILSYHVVPGTRFYANSMKDGGEMQTVLGDSLMVSTSGGTVTLANGSVVNADLQASNGVMHGVDTVLLPGVSATNATVKGKGKPNSGTTATGKEKESN